MSFKKGINARQMLGYQVLSSVQQIIGLLALPHRDRSEYSKKVQSVEMVIRYQDAQLASFREYMKIIISEDGKKVSLNYDAAMKRINERLNKISKEYEGIDPVNEAIASFPLLIQWSELLASCYDKLQLQPEGSTEGEETSNEPEGVW